jgi:hypothetical protein
VRERGLLFSATMVRALLEGRKTQTRRPVNLPEAWHYQAAEHGRRGATVLCARADGTGRRAIACPYGAPGDRIWVRETWQIVYDGCGPCCECWNECHCIERTAGEQAAGTPLNGCKHASVAYRATDTAERLVMDGGDERHSSRWRPSIFMPRWASRLTLEIDSVRIARLQDTSPSDIRAEGVGCPKHDFAAGFCHSACDTQRDAWVTLWDSINSRRLGSRWAHNPLVWALTFHTVPQEQQP